MPTPFADVVRDHRDWLLAAAGQAALETGLWEALAQPRTAERLAADLLLDAHATGCVLAALQVGGCAQRAGDRYTQGPRPVAVALPDTGWGRLPAFLRTGAPLLRGPLPGDPGDHEARRRYLEHLDTLAGDVADEVARLLPEPVLRCVDVGCGLGRFALAVRDRHPEARVVGVDGPEVVELARRHREGSGITFLGADVRTLPALPGQPTHVLIANVLHLYRPAEAQQLAALAAASLDPGGWLAVVDVRTEADGVAPDLPVLFALDLALHTGGSLHTMREIAAWMGALGLAVTCNHALACAPETGLVVARRPQQARNAVESKRSAGTMAGAGAFR